MNENRKPRNGPVYYVTLNGRTSFELQDMPLSPREAELDQMIENLDGEVRFAILIGMLPDGIPFDRVDLDAEPVAYMQCAGGVRGRFTCEVRTLDATATPVHLILGRRDRDPGTQKPTVAIAYSAFESNVEHHEVLDRDEVRDLLQTYVATGELHPDYTQRRVTFDNAD